MTFPSEDLNPRLRTKFVTNHRGATAGKAPKAWALPRCWVSIHSFKKRPVKKIWDRIVGLAWLKFAVAALPKSRILL